MSRETAVKNKKYLSKNLIWRGSGGQTLIEHLHFIDMGTETPKSLMISQDHIASDWTCTII